MEVILIYGEQKLFQKHQKRIAPLWWHGNSTSRCSSVLWGISYMEIPLSKACPENSKSSWIHNLEEPTSSFSCSLNSPLFNPMESMNLSHLESENHKKITKKIWVLGCKNCFRNIKKRMLLVWGDWRPFGDTGITPQGMNFGSKWSCCCCCCSCLWICIFLHLSSLRRWCSWWGRGTSGWR